MKKFPGRGHELEDDIGNLLPLIKLTANNSISKDSDEPEPDLKTVNGKVSKPKKNNPSKRNYYRNRYRPRKAKEKTPSPQMSDLPQEEVTVEICPTETKILVEGESLEVPLPTDVPEAKTETKNNNKKKTRRKNRGRINKKNKIDIPICDNPSPESSDPSCRLNSPKRNNSAIDDLSLTGGRTGKYPRDFQLKKIKRFKKKLEKRKTPPESIEESPPERLSILDLDDEVVYRPHEVVINSHDPFKYTRYDGGCCRDQFRIYDLEYFRTNHILVNGENYLLFRDDIFKMIAKADAIVFEGKESKIYMKTEQYCPSPGCDRVNISRDASHDSVQEEPCHRIIEFGVLLLKRTQNGILEPDRIYTMRGISKDPRLISPGNSPKYEASNSDSFAISGSDFSQIANAIISRKNLQLIVFNGLVSLTHLFSNAGQIFAQKQEFFERYSNQNFTIIDTHYISERFIKEGIVKGIQDLLIKRFIDSGSYLQVGAGYDAFLTWQLYESLVNSFLFTNNFWIGGQFCPIEELKRYYGKLSRVPIS